MRYMIKENLHHEWTILVHDYWCYYYCLYRPAYYHYHYYYGAGECSCARAPTLARSPS